jgi:predicted nucleic acid-binding protein
MKYILDACALITLINREEGCEKVNELFVRAYYGELELYISVVNMIEVFYEYIRSDGLEKASEILAPTSKTGLKIIDTIPQTVYQEAARLKAIYKRISIADVIGLAAAKDLGAAFVTSDHHEMDIIERTENIKFMWVR